MKANNTPTHSPLKPFQTLIKSTKLDWKPADEMVEKKYEINRKTNEMKNLKYQKQEINRNFMNICLTKLEHNWYK